jgi:hypothetical protein
MLVPSIPLSHAFQKLAAAPTDWSGGGGSNCQPQGVPAHTVPPDRDLDILATSAARSELPLRIWRP